MHPLRANQFVFAVLRSSQILACTGLLLCSAALFIGCKSRNASSQIGRLRLSDNELRYGVAPTRNSEVVYQDDVIIVGHGADDVRSVSADGLTWTIDASAAHAEELQPGKIMAYAVLRLQDPALHFNLDIHGGKVTTAELELKGVAGLTMQFEAASTVGVNGNINKRISVPVDLSLPILGLPVPLAVTLHQAFILKTAFSARNSVLRATGDYAMDGSLFMGYHNGSWGAGAPTKFVVRQSLLDSINGVSLGANGLGMAYQGKVIVGIGAFGFVTGPYFGYNVGIGVARGSDAAGFPLGMPVCRSANLDVGVAVGIGYSIPQPVTNAINFILRNLNLRAIEGSGGIEHRESLINQHAAIPAGCS